MRIVELLKNANVKLHAPMPAQDIAALEAETKGPLPAELRAMVELCRGFDCASLEEFGVNGDYLFSGERWFPQSVPIAGDGAGNFYVVDLSGKPSDKAPVYFVCHDAPVIVLVARSVTEFVESVLSAERNIGDLTDEYMGKIWRDNPGVIEHAEAMNADEAMRNFAAKLDDKWLFVDMRNAAPGDGFSWGRYGAETKNKRAGREPIFAYQKRKLNWFQRTFGV